MSEPLRYALVWIAAAVVAIFVTLQMAAASYIDGQYLPVGHDAFYHGHRILDAIASGRVFQFDPAMHIPEGDWVTWPWGYDFVMAIATRGLMSVTGSSDPMATLAHVPPLLAVIAVTLLVAVCVELKLSTRLTFVAAMCFALHAFTQYQFGVGALDHHGVEQITMLGALWVTLRWMSRPDSRPRAFVAGAWLAAVLSAHAALLLLQLPLLAALLLRWWRGVALPRASAQWFCGALVAVSLCVLLPSATFWQGRFELYYLSWLHLYVAACTSLVVLVGFKTPFGRRGILRLIALGAALALPLLAALGFFGGFITGDLATISDIDEVQSPFVIAGQEYGLARVNQLYTLLFWISPATFLACVVMAWRESDAVRSAFWVFAAFGLALTLAQLRLGSFGVYYMYLPLIVLAALAEHRWPRAAGAVFALLVVAMLVAYYPTVRYQLFSGRVPAMDQQFASLRPVIPVLQSACAKEPGVVLAEPGDGHLIRYFTKCAVIANNFRLTPLDVAKVEESLGLIAMPLGQMREEAPFVKYIVARLVAPNESPNPVLFHELFAGKWPENAGVETLVEAKVDRPDGTSQKFLGVYRLSPPAVTRSPASSPGT